MLFTELSVTINADYSPAPGEALENLAANEFRAASDFIFTCVVEGASGNLSYSWSLDGRTAPQGAANSVTLFLSPLYPEYAGSYICSVSESGRSDIVSSDPYPVRIIGM